MQTGKILIERTFDAPVEQVWMAITDKDQMKKWYFDIAEFIPEVGFEFKFEGGNEEKRYLHSCKITEKRTNRKLAYSWRYDGQPGITQVIFELFPEGDATRLRLIHEGLESFPKGNPDLAEENFAAGWEHIIGTSLREFLEKGTIKKSVKRRTG